MKLKEIFKSFCTDIKVGVSRFLIPFISSVLLYLTISYEVIFETEQDKIIVPLCMAFGLVAVLSVLFKITEEYIFGKLTPVIQYILSVIIAAVAFIVIKTNYDSLYMIMAYSGIIIASLCFIFFILMRGKNRDIAFPKIFTSWIFSGAVCCVLSGGLSICIAAFQSLIFFWNDIYKLYLTVNLFVWIIGFINIFLSFIPEKDIAASQSKIFRIFVLFAGLPLYILLIAILLVYLAKIVITRNMPVGEINLFASFASLFFIFFLMSVMQYSEKTAKLFVKFGGYFLIPVLIMQAIAVFERISAYGLTTPRTVSLVLIIISILFILSSIIAPKHLNKAAFISGIIVLIVTVTPLNIIDMPVKSQTNILTTVLKANGMLKDGKVVPKSNINNKDAQKIVSAYEYLKYNAKKTPDYIPDSKKNTKEIFGFSMQDAYKDDNILYCSFSTKTSVDITEYDKMIEINDNNGAAQFEHNSRQYNIDLKEIAKGYYDKYGTDKTELDIYIVDENTALYFRYFNFEVNNDEIKYCHCNGYALVKN